MALSSGCSQQNGTCCCSGEIGLPEIDALDKWFGNGLGHSVDKLLAGGNDD